jgi:hypothetical protein
VGWAHLHCRVSGKLISSGESPWFSPCRIDTQAGFGKACCDVENASLEGSGAKRRNPRALKTAVWSRFCVGLAPFGARTLCLCILDGA